MPPLKYAYFLVAFAKSVSCIFLKSTYLKLLLIPVSYVSCTVSPKNRFLAIACGGVFLFLSLEEGTS